MGPRWLLVFPCRPASRGFILNSDRLIFSPTGKPTSASADTLSLTLYACVSRFLRAPSESHTSSARLPPRAQVAARSMLSELLPCTCLFLQRYCHSLIRLTHVHLGPLRVLHLPTASTAPVRQTSLQASPLHTSLRCWQEPPLPRARTPVTQTSWPR
jgi:hypothetical protein